MGAPATETDQPATSPDADTITWGTINPDMSDEDMGKAVRKAYIDMTENAVIEFSFNPDYPNKDLESFKQFLRDTMFIQTTDNAYLQRFESIKAQVVEDVGPKLFLATQTDIAGYVHQGVQPDNLTQPGVIPGSAAQDKIAKAADPVCLFNGNFLYSSTDLQLDGAGINFSFTRTYSQLSSYNGPMGFKWDHCYNLWIRVSDDPNLLYRSTGSLREETYRRHTQFGYWIPPPGSTGILSEQAGSFVLNMPDGTRLVYEPHQQLHPLIHVISRMEDRFGNYLQFNYLNGLLSTVEVNHSDRTVRFFYDTENRITALTDFTGRSWRYRYDDLGDMVAITTPATERFPRGTTTVLEYSSATMSDLSAQHNLVSITDPQGYIFLENEYGTEKNLVGYNRVIRQRQGWGDIFFDYADVIETFSFPYKEHERPVCQTIVTERDGKQTRYLFNRLGNMIFREEYARLNGIPTLVSSHYRYNGDGNLTGMISNLGVITQYLYGRDFFEKKFPPSADYRAEEDSNLTASVRQSFPHLLAIVCRGHYHSLNALSLGQGLWSDSIFPDIYATGPQDIIQKFSYEPDFFQLQSVSDPRFTDSANPGFAEQPDYFNHLTKYHFQAFGGTGHFYLSAIELPHADLPDGSAAEPVVTRFTAYDAKGRLLQTIAPNGLEIQNTYFDADNDTREGFLRDTTLDPGGLGIKAGVERDALGRIIQVNSPGFYTSPGDRFFTRNVFNALGQLVRSVTTAPFSVAAEYSYNRAGNLVRCITELKDAANNSTGYFDSVYRFDPEFNLVRQETGNPDAGEIKRERNVFDRAGRLSISISPSGYKTKSRYNERGLLWQTIADYGGVHAMTKRYFDADGRVIRTIDPSGNIHRFTYDTAGRPVLTEDPLGNKIVRHFDKAGNLTLECFFENQGAGLFRLLSRKSFVYDAIGRRFRSGVNKFEAASVPPVPETQLLSAFAGAGPGELLETESFYNAIGQVAKVVDQSGRAFKAEFDITGRLIKRIDPFGNEVSYTYDSESNVLQVDRKELTREGVSNNITGEKHFRETAAYDEMNRLVQHTDSLGNVSQWKYDSRSNKVGHTDALGNNTEIEFDVFSRPVQVSRHLHNYLPGEVPELVRMACTYYTNDRVRELTDALGRKTVFEYDSAERLTATLLPDGSRDRTTYDRSNNIVEYEDRNGVLHRCSFDPLGRNIEVRIDPGSAAGFTGETLYRTGYDGIGRVVSVAHDHWQTIFSRNSLGWITEEIIHVSGVPGALPAGSSLKREFNNNGMQTAVAYPSGRRLVYTRDVLDRIVSIAQTSGGAGYPGSAAGGNGGVTAAIEYEGFHRKRISRSNGSSTSYTWDAGSRVTEIKHAMGSQPFLTLQFLYDALGNMRQQVEQSDEHSHTSVYAYDSFSRLTGASSLPHAGLVDMRFFEASPSPPGPGSPTYQSVMDSLLPAINLPANRGYEYDATGNRLAVLTGGGAGQLYTVNELDQYRQINGQSFDFDATGNLREDDSFTYNYNHLNQLTRVRSKTDNATIEYLYDPFGRRFAEVGNAEVRTMVYDGQRLLEEYVNGALHTSHAGEPGDDTPLISSRAETEFYLYSDRSKSVRHVYNNGVKSNYYRYDEFGNTVQTLQPEDKNPFRFAGKRLLPETGKYDFVFRTYDPQSGRFLQRDPKGFVDGTNRYTYVKNNPLVHIDPLGMESRPETGGNDFVRKFTGAFRAANTPVDINGKPLKGTYNLWSDIAGGGYAKAKAAPGWIMEQTSEHVIAEAAQQAHPNNATRNIPPGDWDDIWGKPSRSLARRAVISGKPVASFGLDTHPTPHTTMQYQHEIPTVGRWGYFTGGTMKLGGLLNLWDASRSDNPWVKTFGIIGGSAEVLGGTLYMAGAATMHTTAMSIGSGISRYIGGPTTILLSGYAFYNDIKNGNYLDAVGSGSGVLAGGAMIVGWTTGVVFFGSFAGGWSLGRYIDKKTGWSTSLSNRASRNRDIYREELGLGETSSTILGGAANIPVLSEIGQGIGWGAYKLYEADRYVSDKISSAYDSVTDLIGYELCVPFVSCD